MRILGVSTPKSLPMTTVRRRRVTVGRTAASEAALANVKNEKMEDTLEDLLGINCRGPVMRFIHG